MEVGREPITVVISVNSPGHGEIGCSREDTIGVLEPERLNAKCDW